jgi:hypothetical protein
MRSLIATFTFAIVPGLAQSADRPAEKAIASFVESLSGDKPFAKNEGKIVRTAMAKFFQEAYADDIDAGFGTDKSAILSWLDQNPDIKELLFTAIDPEVDQVSQCLAVFRDLYVASPEKVKLYPNLAVACAVVWDNPRNVYDYRGHQVRTRAELPDGVMKNRHVENFKALADGDANFKATLPHLPWEMLIHVVNHFTPASERSWAVSQHLKRKAMIGKTYADVKYDNEMLRTEMRNGPGKGDCKITGKAYTLENLKLYGGVCAQQADYAARVAKSMAVPAEYVGGEGNSGGRHAWVMWVEIKSATKEKLDVTLQSEGRYLIDQYYVGTLLDPKSGREMTDRELELRLASIVLAPKDGRQADLLMRAYPLVKEQKKLEPKQQLEYLRKVIDLFPYCDRAWTDRAALIKSGALNAEAQAALNLSDTNLRIFHNYPDFSWKYADDILTPVKSKSARALQFEKLANRYEQLSRPDLACEARLKLVEYQVEAKEYQKAAEGLTKTIGKFPSEGRYVPKMLDQLQKVATEYKGGPEKLTKFYLTFLPAVPPTRGTEVSKYCIEVHEQALAFVSKHGKPIDAKRIENQIAVLKRGGR